MFSNINEKKLHLQKMNLYKFIASCAVTLIYSIPVFAQVTGPLGFTWGGSHTQLETSSQINLSLEQDIMDSDVYSCARHTLTNVGMAPDSWKTDYSDYLSGDYGGASSNDGKADGTMGGRLSAYLYNVDVLGLTVKACGAFIDDQLYSINIENGNFNKRDGIRFLIEESLSQKYGASDTICGSSFCISMWTNEKDKVFIEWMTHDSLSYFYGPLKAKQVESWSKYYVDFVKSSTSKSNL